MASSNFVQNNKHNFINYFSHPLEYVTIHCDKTIPFILIAIVTLINFYVHLQCYHVVHIVLVVVVVVVYSSVDFFLLLFIAPLFKPFKRHYDFPPITHVNMSANYRLTGALFIT